MTLRNLPFLSLIPLFLSCGGATTDTSSGPDSVGDDTAPTYTDACEGDAEQWPSWDPVAGQATVTARFLSIDAESTREIQFDGEGLHLSYSDDSGGCWFHLPEGGYTLRLVVGGEELATLETGLFAERTSVVVGLDHPTNGPEITVFPLETAEPDGQWRVNVLNVAQDVKPEPLDVYLWPTGTTTEDSTSVTPAEVVTELAYGTATSVLISPYITSDEKDATLAPSAILAFVPHDTACNPATVAAEFLMPCMGNPKDVPFMVLGMYAFCAGDTLDDDPDGPCYQTWGNPAIGLTDGVDACW
jgi:hypothetical protein